MNSFTCTQNLYLKCVSELVDFILINSSHLYLACDILGDM